MKIKINKEEIKKNIGIYFEKWWWVLFRVC